MWNLRTDELRNGLRCRVAVGANCLTFDELFDLFETSENFADWFSDSLAGTPNRGFFWEHPPLTTGNLGDDAEFVLTGSESLARLQADPLPFMGKFDQARGMDVITFDNLSGDARLVVPTPEGPLEAYPHLVAFLRGAPRQQVRSLWKVTAKALRETLCDTPRWLSTAGLGVSWLHLRIDTRPKYYRYDPYKAAM